MGTPYPGQGLPNIDLSQLQMPGSPGGANYGLPGTSMDLRSMPGLGGAMQMTDFNNLQDTIARNFRGSDLQAADAMNTYQNKMALNPLLDVQRQTAMLQAQLQQKQLQPGGLTEQAQTTGLQAQIAKNLASQSTDQIQALDSHLRAAYTMGTMLQDKNYNANDAAQRQAVLQVGRDAGLADMPQDITPDVQQQILTKANSAVHALPVTQAILQGNTHYMQQVGASNAAAGKGELEVKNEGIIAQGIAYANRMLVNQPQTQQVLNSVDQTIAQQGYATPELAQRWMTIMKDEMKYGQGEQAYDAVLEQNRKSLITSGAVGIIAAAKDAGIPEPEKIPSATLAAKVAAIQTDSQIEESLAQKFKDRFSGNMLKVGDTTVPIAKATTQQLMIGTSGQTPGPQVIVAQPPGGTRAIPVGKIPTSAVQPPGAAATSNVPMPASQGTAQPGAQPGDVPTPANLTMQQKYPPVDNKGWKLLDDGKGNWAYVSPDNKHFRPVQ